MSEQSHINPEQKTITFSNGRQAQAIVAPVKSNAEDVLQALNLTQPNALIMVVGSAANFPDDLRLRLAQLFSRGIARAAVETGAMLIDGGTHCGVMELIGQGVADRGFKSVLIGVVPSGKVTYPGGPADGTIPDGGALDSNHAFFVLVESDRWGGETSMMYALAAQLSENTLPPAGESKSPSGDKPKKIPVVTVLAGSQVSGIAKDEVLAAVRQGWPVIVLEGSGGLADEIIRLLREPPDFIPDPALAEIIGDGMLHVFTAAGSAEALRKAIVRQLGVDEPLLLAWKRLATYNFHATRHQRTFKSLQKWTLVLGVLTTFMVVLKATLSYPTWMSNLDPALRQPVTIAFNIATPALGVVILILPILMTLLLAAAQRYNSGNKWVLLRMGAESIKRAIFIYRTRPIAYRTLPPADTGQAAGPAPAPADEQAVQFTRETELARFIEFISRQLLQSDVNLSALSADPGPVPPPDALAQGDDGFSLLTPERYIAVRLDDQLNFYQNRTSKLEPELRRYQVLTLVAGAVGTFLAAIGLDIWVALTTALAGAFTAFLQNRQTENTLVQYNQTANNLENVKGWWTSLSTEAQAEPTNIRRLVDLTEQNLETENHGWVQQMQDALAKLREEQERAGRQETE